MAGNSNSGRPKKEIEIAMIEKLTPLDDRAFKELKLGLERGDFKYLRLYFRYRWGMPKQLQDITINQEQPLFNL